MSSSVPAQRATRATPSGSPRSSALRWVAAFIAVAVLHGLGALWIERHRELPQPAMPAHVPVQIALLKPQQIERSASPPAAAPARPAAHPAAAKPHPATPHTLTAIAREPHPAVPAQPASSAPAQPASTPTAAPAGQGNGAGNTPAAPAGPASHGVKFSVPPSGDLQYDTFYNGMHNQPGTIHWSSVGDHYEMVVSVSLPFVGTFSWTSRGHVDAFGLAPDQYIEKRGHRPEDVTVFNRNDKQVVFTRTPNSVPLPDGVQDRFSMVMQLASLVRGDPDTYKPGVTREFFVVDNDSGKTWPVTTIGDESVNTDHGFVTARHFMRLPRREGDRRRIDVWFAPSLGWLPVRLVQTEPNGTQFELVWRGPLVVPSAGAAPSGAETETPGENGTNPAIAPPPSAPQQGGGQAGLTGAPGTPGGTANGGTQGIAPASPAAAGNGSPANVPAGQQTPGVQTPAAEAPPTTQAPAPQAPGAQAPPPHAPVSQAPAPQAPAPQTLTP